VRRRIAPDLAFVVAQPDHLSVLNDHGTDRYVVVLQGKIGLAEREAHEVLVAGEEAMRHVAIGGEVPVQTGTPHADGFFTCGSRRTL
jgi:hypothetical protein